jgi:tetratricopeptide (TPR) repeat protein
MKKAIGLVFCVAVLPRYAQADANADAQAGLDAAQHGDMAAAESLLSRAIDSGELDGQGLLAALARRCGVKILLGQVDSAAADCDRAIVLDSEYSIAHMNLAAIYLKQERHEEAIAENDLALQHGGLSDLETAMVYSNRGMSRLMLGRYASAISDFDLSLELNPANNVPYNGRALSYLITGELDKAFSDAEAALKIDPTAADPLNTRGLVWLNRRQYDNAVADFDRFIATSPENWSGHYNRALALFLKSDWTAAIAGLDRALHLLPDLPNALYLRGLAQQKLGQSEPGQKDIDRALAIAPQVEKVMDGLLSRFGPQ